MQGFSSDLPALMVAEISANHGGSLDKAVELVHSAAGAGAQAVKFQSFTPESLSVDSASPFFKLGQDSPWGDFGNTFRLYATAQTPYEWLPTLFDIALDLNLVPFSSPFDLSAIELLEDLGCPIYKVASPEINHTPLIEGIARTGKPTVLSLGVASRQDLVSALEAFRKLSDAPVTVLQCETAYPADPANSNISLLEELVREFGVIPGISDHTIGTEIVPVAVGAGAKLFEKHLGLPGEETVDSHFSATPLEFSEYVRVVRRSELILGEAAFRGDLTPEYRERNTRSVFSVKKIHRGEKLTETNVRIVRPGHGLQPAKYKMVIGRTASVEIPEGWPISEDQIEW